MTTQDTFERFDGKRELRAEWLNRVADAVEKLLRISAAPPLEVRRLPGGVVISTTEPAPLDGFWALLTAEGPAEGQYSWQRLKDDAVTPEDPPEVGEENAWEVNGVLGLEKQVVWMWPAPSLDPPEYRFDHVGLAAILLHSVWAVITEDLGGGEYAFSSGSVVGQMTEVNGVVGIAPGTVVRAFNPMWWNEEGPWGFEYAAGGPAVALEDSFDFIEVWPALVITAGEPISGRVWIPGSGFPPSEDDNYDLTPVGEAVDIAFRKMGAGTFADGTLIPLLQDQSETVEDWIQVRCQPGAFVTEDAATPDPPDGHVFTFSGTLADQPLPYTVTFEYQVALEVPGVSPAQWRRLHCSRTVDAADDFKVALVEGGLGGAARGWVEFRTGKWDVELVPPLPPADAVMRVRYVPVSACAWSWVVTPQTVEGGSDNVGVKGNTAGQEQAPLTSVLVDAWLKVDEEGKVSHIGPKQGPELEEEVDRQTVIHLYADENGEFRVTAEVRGVESAGTAIALTFDSRAHLAGFVIS